METSMAVFRGKEIRKTIHNNEWWFSVVDVVVVLTETANSADYIKKMRKRDAELAKGWGQIVTPPPLVGNIWWQAEGQLRQHRGHFSHYSVHHFAQGRTGKP